MAAMKVPSARLNARLFIDPMLGCHMTTTVNSTSFPRSLKTFLLTAGMTVRMSAMLIVTTYCRPMITQSGIRNAFPGRRFADFCASPNSDANTADRFFSCCACRIAFFVLAIHVPSWDDPTSPTSPTFPSYPPFPSSFPSVDSKPII